MAKKTATKTVAKTHIERPTNEKRMLCGKEKGTTASSPGKATCLSCAKAYKINKDWYTRTKRATTIANKKAAAK